MLFVWAVVFWAEMIVDTYLEAEFQGGRHADRIKKIHEIETM